MWLSLISVFIRLKHIIAPESEQIARIIPNDGDGSKPLNLLSRISNCAVILIGFSRLYRLGSAVR